MIDTKDLASGALVAILAESQAPSSTLDDCWTALINLVGEADANSMLLIADKAYKTFVQEINR